MRKKQSKSYLNSTVSCKIGGILLRTPPVSMRCARTCRSKVFCWLVWARPTRESWLLFLGRGKVIWEFRSTSIIFIKDTLGYICFKHTIHDKCDDLVIIRYRQACDDFTMLVIYVLPWVFVYVPLIRPSDSWFVHWTGVSCMQEVYWLSWVHPSASVIVPQPPYSALLSSSSA